MRHVNVPCTCAHEVVDPSRSLLKTFVPASFPRNLEDGVDADAHPEVTKQVSQMIWRGQLDPATLEGSPQFMQTGCPHCLKGCFCGNTLAT